LFAISASHLSAAQLSNSNSSSNQSVFFCNIAANIGEPARFTINNDRSATSHQLFYKQCQTFPVPSVPARGNGVLISVSAGNEAANSSVNLSPINAYNIILAVPGQNGNGIQFAFPTSLIQSQSLPDNQQVIFYGNYPIGYNQPIDFIVNGQTTVQYLAPYQSTPPETRPPYQDGQSVEIQDGDTKQLIATGFKVPILPQTTQQSILFAQCGIQGNTDGRPLEVFYTFTEQGIDNGNNGNDNINTVDGDSSPQSTSSQASHHLSSASFQVNQSTQSGVATGAGAEHGSAIGFTVPAPTAVSQHQQTAQQQQQSAQQQTSQRRSTAQHQTSQQSTNQQARSLTGAANGSLQSTGVPAQQQQSAQQAELQSSTGTASQSQQESANQQKQQSTSDSQDGSNQQSTTGSNGNNASGSQSNDNDSNNASGPNNVNSSNGISPNAQGAGDGCAHGNSIVVGNTLVCTTQSNEIKSTVETIVALTTIFMAATLIFLD